MRILALVAGTNEPSNCDCLTDVFLENAKRMGSATVEKLFVRDLALAHFSLACYEPDFEPEEDFQKLQRLVEGADGILVASPIWNFGVPAHLKNLIDRLGAFGLDRETRSKGTLRGKPFFLIFTGGAPAAAWKGLMQFTTRHVPEAFQYFGATHVGTHFEGKCMVGRGVFGCVVPDRPETLSKLRREGERFGSIVAGYARDSSLPLRSRLREKLYNVGKAIMQRL
jgi:NAD(P)H-dependent FMN reductase